MLLLNFIVDLPALLMGSNFILAITDKYSKYIRLIPGKKTTSANIGKSVVAL